MNFSKAVKTQEGSIDLASVMVGVVVSGILAGTVAAIVFGLIPWAQDNDAKTKLQSIEMAQAFSLDSEGAYLGLPELKASGFYTPSSPDDIVSVETIAAGAESGSVAVFTDGGCYTAAALSASGTIFYITESDNVATTTVPARADCVDTTDIGKMLKPTPGLTQASTPTKLW